MALICDRHPEVLGAKRRASKDAVTAEPSPFEARPKEGERLRVTAIVSHSPGPLV